MNVPRECTILLNNIHNFKNRVKNKMITLFNYYFIRNPNKFIILFGALCALLIDLVFFRTMYISHMIYCALLTWTFMFIKGTCNIMNDLYKDVCGCCDQCKSIFRINDKCLIMANLENKSLRLEFCNSTCLEKATNRSKNSVLNSLIFKEHVHDTPVNDRKCCNVWMFLLCCPWSIKMHSIDLLEYIIILRFNKKYISMYQRFILFMVDKCNIA